MSSSTTCSVVDDYAVLFDGALYIRKVNKNATPEEKRERRAQYMKRYRTGRKGVKKEGAKKKRKQGTDEAQQEQKDAQQAEGAQQQQKEGAQQQQEDDVIARVE